MEILLQGYAVNPATWFYLSTLLILAVFFRFNRLWSLRNVDLLLLLSFTPGLLLVDSGNDVARPLGYVWLFSVSGMYVVRLLADQFPFRRPLLAPNLNAGGLAFLCVSAAAFLTAQAVKETLPVSTQATVVEAEAMVKRQSTPVPEHGAVDEPVVGPAATLIAAPVGIVFEDLAARVLSVLAHAAVVTGLLMAGKRLFGDAQLGLAMATLYLLLPCTAFRVGEFNQVLPSALIVWAIVCYRNPIVSGILMGLACGTMFFPVFLLPLWIAFYGRKGFVRFSGALAVVALVMVGCLALTSSDASALIRKTLGTIDLASIAFRGDGIAEGFWKETEYLSVYRIPVIAAYAVMLLGLTIWPMKRNLELLIAHSTLVIVGTQFWYPRQGGVFILWYLPLLLMVVFRPRLVHLLPPTVVPEAEESNVRPGTSPVIATRAIDRSSVFR
ncbi:hypothetical protein [Planctomyces sp. SH-PL14]|uniref:hypothetical protein n=1 Tax=Planctomyces sp. SH-PL14 TaxID=1632864 RepID=UPI00078C5AE8|nr:hypothetical protein [Planctomyces sp. SH-PL14]AMV22220.1 hypothetical protein VT03_30225 [Planctomyces sp. SH-PL14]